jgi:HSP20 family protein
MSVGDLIPWRRRNAVATRSMRDPFAVLHDEIDRLFDDFARGFDLPSFVGRRSGWPSIDLREDEKKFYVEAELPGMDEKDIEVLLTDNVLTIRGEKRAEHQDEGRQYWTERYVGQFERRLQLPAEVQADEVKATFKKGVLRLEIPKAPEVQARSRRIPISS